MSKLSLMSGSGRHDLVEIDAKVIHDLDGCRSAHAEDRAARMHEGAAQVEAIAAGHGILRQFVRWKTRGE